MKYSFEKQTNKKYSFGVMKMFLNIKNSTQEFSVITTPSARLVHLTNHQASKRDPLDEFVAILSTNQRPFPRYLEMKR